MRCHLVLFTSRWWLLNLEKLTSDHAKWAFRRNSGFDTTFHDTWGCEWRHRWKRIRKAHYPRRFRDNFPCWQACDNNLTVTTIHRCIEFVWKRSQSPDNCRVPDNYQCAFQKMGVASFEHRSNQVLRGTFVWCVVYYPLRKDWGCFKRKLCKVCLAFPTKRLRTFTFAVGSLPTLEFNILAHDTFAIRLIFESSCRPEVLKNHAHKWVQVKDLIMEFDTQLSLRYCCFVVMPRAGS